MEPEPSAVVAASASRSSAASPASSHTLTAANLNRRGICAVEAPYNSDYDDPSACRHIFRDLFGLVCPDLLATLGAGREDDDASRWPPELTAAYENLLETFDTKHASEQAFNVMMFERMGQGLESMADRYGSPFNVHVTATEIVLEPKRRAMVGGNRGSRRGTDSDDDIRAATSSRKAARAPSSIADVKGGTQDRGMEYAMGLAREVRLPSDPSCIMNREAKLDHACVLYQRPVGSSSDEGWKLWKVLAAVELKTRETGVCGLTRSSSGKVHVRSPNPMNHHTHGPLAQVIMYTVAHVLRGVAAALGELPDRIPFAAIVCKKDGGSEKSKERGWAHGHLVCPEVAGFPYAFEVDAFGTVHEAKGANHASLAAYSHVLTHSLQRAAQWLTGLAEKRLPSLPAPHPICGRRVHFGFDPECKEGNEVAQCVLAATPVSKYGIRSNLRISQGELFEATVNLHELRERNLDRVYWCSDAYPNEPEPVMIKVSSASCFNQLIPSVAAYLYGLEHDVWELRRVVREVLSHSLYGAYKTTGGGLVQLLPNLESQEYKTLCPIRWLNPTSWSDLWGAFTVFVKSVLIPLSKYDIVHADIRAGHDVTSNIMYNSAKRSMRLIDLDSLCSFEKLSLHLPQIIDNRHINPKRFSPVIKTALGYVLVQVVCVAEAWLQGIPDRSVNTGHYITEMETSYYDVYGNVIIKDEAPINDALAQYKGKIERKFRE